MATPKRARSAGTESTAALLAALIDEAGAIEGRLGPHRADIAREEVVRKAIRQHYDQHLPLNCFDAHGAKFTALIGARELQSVVDKARLIKFIGSKAFQEIATVTLKAIEKRGPGLLASCVSKMATGTRPLKIFARETA